MDASLVALFALPAPMTVIICCAHVCVKLVQDTKHTHTDRQEGKAAASSVQVRRDFRPNEYSYDVLRPRLLGFDSELSRIC